MADSNNTPLPASAVLFAEDEFSYGVNAREREFELNRKGMLRNAVNVYIDSQGALRCRKGNSVFSSITGSGTITIKGFGFYRSPSKGTILVVAYWDDGVAGPHKMCVSYYSGGTWYPLKWLYSRIVPPATEPILTTYIMNWHNYDVRMVMSGDLLVIFNGQDRPICWNGELTGGYGTNDEHPLTHFGVSQGDNTFAATFVMQSAPYLPDFGHYYYYMAFSLNSDGAEYNYWSSILGTLNENNPLHVNVDTHGYVKIEWYFTTCDIECEKVRIYRSLVQTTEAYPSLSQFYLLVEMDYYNESGFMRYDDYISNDEIKTHSSLVSEYLYGINDHDLPPQKMRNAVMHKGRLFCNDNTEGDESIEFYSRVGDTMYFPPTNNVEVAPGDGQRILNIKETDRGMGLYKEDSFYTTDTTFGADPTQWETRKVSEHGIVAENSLCNIQDPLTGVLSAIRVAKDGVFLTNGEVDVPVCDHVWNLLKNKTATELAAISAYYVRQEGLYVIENIPFDATPILSGTTDQGTTTQQVIPKTNGIIVHTKKPITDADGRFAGLACTFTDTRFTKHLYQFSTEDDNIYALKYGDNDTLYRVWTGNTDAGNNINTLIRTRPIPPSNRLQSQRFRNFWLLWQADNAILDVYYIIDLGAVNGVFANQAGNSWQMLLDNYIYDKLAWDSPNPGTAGTGGSMALGTYTYRYCLANATTAAAATKLTYASDDSAPITVAATGKVTLKLPGYKDAFDKGYTHYLVYRTKLTDTSNYYSVPLTPSSTFEIKADGSDQILAVDTFADVSLGTATLANPPTELLWSTSQIKKLRLPTRGHLNARAVGDNVTFELLASVAEDNFAIIGLGGMAKPKAIR